MKSGSNKTYEITRDDVEAIDRLLGKNSPPASKEYLDNMMVLNQGSDFEKALTMELARNFGIPNDMEDSLILQALTYPRINKTPRELFRVLGKEDKNERN